MIIGIEGGISQGKTLVQTFLMLKERRELHKPLYANYALRETPYKQIDRDWLIEAMQQGFNFGHGHVCESLECDSPEEGHNGGCAIGLDEMHVLLDSRASATKASRLLSYFILQTGKEGINLYYTTQDLGQVDVRLRRRTDLSIRVEKRNGDLHQCFVLDRTQPDPKHYRFGVRGRHVWPFYYTKQVIRNP